MDPNQLYAGRSTALHLSIGKGREQTALFLIDQVPGCDVNNADHADDRATGITPLMLACHAGWQAVVRALVAKGANVHAADSFNRTALVYAAMNGKDTVGAHLVAEAGAAWLVPGGRAD